MTRKLQGFVIICFFLSVFVHYQSIAQTAEEKQVLTAVETLKKALLDGKRSQLEDIAAEELSYGHSSGKVEDKAAFVEALASGKSDFIAINLTDQTVKVIGNTAIVRHNLTGENMDGGKQNPVKLAVLLIWQKQKGKWKLLARQATKI